MHESLPGSTRPAARRRAHASRRSVAGLLAMIAISLLAPTALHAIVISEIHYHPNPAAEAAAGGTSLEWIEIYNDEPTVVHLGGWWFSDGVQFIFPHDTWLDGRSYLVVCADEAAVRAKYGITNTIGNFFGRLENNGEKISLNIYAGGPVASVSYSDRDQWSQIPDGTGHTLALINPYLDPTDNDNWRASAAPDGTPGAENFPPPAILETELLPDDAVWRYRKNTSEYPAGWSDPGFDDSTWFEGATGIGYGDDDDRTVLADMRGSYQSIACRRSVTLSAQDLAAFDDIVFQIDYDDGFVAYLNGVEFARNRMRTEGPPSFTDAASSREAGNYEDYFLPASRLVVGVNTFAVAVHNATINSSDFSFIPRLVGRRLEEQSRPVPVIINEVFTRGAAGSGWIELFNTSDLSVDLSGFHLSDSPFELTKFTIANGTVLAPGEHRVFTAAATGLLLEGLEVKVFLSRPGGTRVVAAQHFETPLALTDLLAGRSEARTPDGKGRFQSTATPTPGAANEVALGANLVIHEIFYNPPASHAGLSFIELYNLDLSPVDLEGFRFNRGVDFAFPAGTVIPGGGYLVVAESPDLIRAVYGLTEVAGPWLGTLSNRGELIRLVDSFGNIVDEVRYHDDGRWSQWADGGGSSLELLDPYEDNSVASSWEASDESSKSAWEFVELPITGYAPQAESEFQIRMLGAAEVLMDSISMERSGTEYIVNGGFETSTSPWIIEGTHVQSHRTTEDAYEGNACLKIVATGDGDVRANRIEEETNPRLVSGNYTVRFAVKWLRGANLIYLSGYRQTRQSQLTHWITLPAQLGTPGAPNSVGVDNMGPAISEVKHSPAVPSTSQTVHVRARVSDVDGVARVSAFYRRSGSTDSVPLFDDGLHDDEKAGDGIYGGELPAPGSAVKVEFWVEAEDALAAVRSFPREAPARALVFEHTSPISAQSFTYRLILDDANWSELNSRRLHSNEMLDATFVFNEEHVYYNVGTRYRGSPWQRPGNPRMFRVNFNKDDPLRGQFRSVNLSRYGSEQRERAAFYSTWRTSTPASTSPMTFSSWGRVRHNGGTATMEAVRPINSDFLDTWFPGDSDGNLMKITGKQTYDDQGNHVTSLIQWANFSNRGTDKGNYRWNFNPRTNELADDFNPLANLVALMNGSASVLDETLPEIMDVEQWLRVYAARCAHDDWDTIGIGNGQNAYIYFAANEGRWKLLPWDLDHSWGNASARLYPDADPAMARILQRPQYRRKYQGILNEMLNGRGSEPGHWTTGEIVTKFLDRNSTVVAADGVANSGAIRNFINSRTGSLRAQIPSRIDFEISTNNGADLVWNEASLELDGRGWVDIDTVLVNGEPAELRWTSTTRWELDVDVFAGENLFTLIAIDVTGELVGSDSINVVSTVGWDAPEVTAIAPPSARPGEMVRVTGIEFHEGLEVLFDDIDSPLIEFDEAADATTLRAEVPLLRAGVVSLVVRNVDGRGSPPQDFEVLSLPPQFVRGDSNTDGALDLSDAVRIVRYLFAGLPTGCVDAADVDDSGVVNITDAIDLLSYLYQEGAAPAAPFPEAGEDPTADASDCEIGVDLFAE